ncbi:discoidin domain-containing protein [Eubacterium ventriosum]|uniref:discoidin domain-containing protein n=1 Tax=Eubacterium ventriosum TaxID=39496 RepID=UPI000E46BA9C|nr:discoidin domain-containing protein [Eubacterium ventriosum]RHD10692.1 hypothetical protein DW809_11175 [Eubacterium ventriosum]
MSKSFKKLVAIVSAIAMVIAGITVQPQTANAAEALEWSELTDGLKKATIKNTSTEEVRGVEYKGFETDRSWGGDSKWQGQAIVNDVTVEAGQAYKVSLDVSSTPAKKILVQTLSGGEYVEKEYDTTVGHIEQTFAANNDKVNIVVAFGSFSDDEVGTYDVSISNLKLEKTEKSEEQIEKERVEALLTGDENIAKGKTAFSNSVKETGYQPEEAFDGNLGSRYAAESYESGVTLGVDLGKTYKVSSVAFKWEGAYATEYNIQVSKDGKAYDTVKTMTADKAETIEVPLDEAVEARYVRIECVKNAINYGYSLWEMGVYGTEVAEVETTTPVVEPGTVETTTPAKQDETTTPAKQDETTTPAPVVPTVPVAAEKDWSAEDFIGSTDATYNDTYKAIKDGAINEIVNIQKADDTLGLYVSFADADFGTITVNGKAADIKVAGAGIWFKLSNFTDMYSDVVITNGAGTVKATLYVYNKNGVDNSKKDDETTTPAKPTVAPTTVAPTTVAPTTVAPTTVAPTTVAPTAKPTETPTAKPTETPTAKPTVAPTAKPTVAPTTKAISTTAVPATVKKTTVKKTTVKATAKKLSSNKVKLSVKKVAGASKYSVQISTTKNFKKVVAKKTSKKAVFTVKSKKLKGKKKLYVRVKVYKKVNGKTVASQWSKATKIRVKK